jgi:hypothetical protein
MSASPKMSLETPASFVFLPDQLKMLQDTLPEVQKKETRKDKHRMIKSIRKNIMELPESIAMPLEQREDLKIAIDCWFSRRTKGRSHKIKFGKTWSGRLVMYEEQRERVNELKERLYEKAKEKGKEKGRARRGTAGKSPRSAFHYFQKAISKLWDELDGEEQERCRMVAQKWNSEGVSREMKQQ